MLKLSIVIPVFNVEPYLAKCLSSCLNQDMVQTDYEIIIVNDGSTDSSLEIAQNFADKYKNLSVFSQINQGQSAARNFGLTMAKGDYVWYVDPDDWVEPNILQRLYKEVTSDNLDCLWFKWQRVDSEGRVFIDSSDNTMRTNSTNVESGVSFLNNQFGYACYSCAFWFKRSFLMKYSFYYKEGVIFEDVELIPRILLHAHAVKFLSLLCYNYLMRKGSSIKSVSEKKYRDLKMIICDIDNFYSEAASPYFDRLFSSLVVLGLKLVASDAYRSYRVDFLISLKKRHRKLIVFDCSVLNILIVGMSSISYKMSLYTLVALRRVFNK